MRGVSIHHPCPDINHLKSTFNSKSASASSLGLSNHAG
jgi:hypothetical protein